MKLQTIPQKSVEYRKVEVIRDYNTSKSELPILLSIREKEDESCGKEDTGNHVAE